MKTLPKDIDNPLILTEAGWYWVGYFVILISVAAYFIH